VLVLLAVLALLGLPTLRGGLRAEDWLAVETYSRRSLVELWGLPHLDMALYGYWRPLSDSVAWLLVRATGATPWALQLALLALHVGNALLAGAVLRRLFGLSAGAGIATSLVAVAHPWSAAVVTYLDGGTSALLTTTCTLLALHALAAWREGERGLWLPALSTLAAGLAYDPAILLPVIVLVVGVVLPRRERSVPWPLLGLIPLLLLVRWWAVGRPFDGYVLSAESLLEFPARLARCTARLFLPFFPEHGGPAVTLTVALAAVAVAAVVAAVATRAGDPRVALRQGAALLLACVGALGFAPDLFVGGIGAPPDELVLAYKSYPAALLAALTIGWLLARASGRRGLGSLVLAAPVVLLLWIGGAPIRAEHARAHHWVGAITAGVAAQAEAAATAAAAAGEPAPRHLVLEVPVKVESAGRSATRALMFGLPASLRPPFHEPERFAYPLFRRELDSWTGWVSEPAMTALCASAWFKPLRCRWRRVDGREEIVVEPVPRPAAAPPPGPVRLFATLDGSEPLVADVAEAPRVRLSADGSIVLSARGTPPDGTLRFLVLNRVHPCVADRVEYANDLPGVAPPPAGVTRVRIGAPWLREIARRYPDDVAYVLLEVLATESMLAHGAPPAIVSNIVPLRLHAGD